MLISFLFIDENLRNFVENNEKKPIYNCFEGLFSKNKDKTYIRP